ncbi:hypothetical protein AOV_03770 [Anaplasma ovis str. Haibei]|uniref:Uncharacterized protein n=1 Tax=Anaplasma ovis str. Haibei TaxID=1248439 RepID=A0A2Z2L8K5_9RICK|nr:hypothetical protein AOV_03770 [Anaplasma ovis str. Haibei]
MYIPEDCFSSSLAGVITSLALGHVACGRLFSFDGRGVVPVFGSCGMGACGNFSLGAAGPRGYCGLWCGHFGLDGRGVAPGCFAPHDLRVSCAVWLGVSALFGSGGMVYHVHPPEDCFSSLFLLRVW